MNKFIIMLLLTIGFLLPAGLSAQSNDVLDVFLNRSEADLGTSAYLVLAAMKDIDESSSIDEALAWMNQSGKFEKIKNPDAGQSISYGEFSYLIMETLNLKGGVMYRLFPGPRYAAREIAYRKWIVGKSIPGRILKPFEVINALITILDEEGTK